MCPKAKGSHAPSSKGKIEGVCLEFVKAVLAIIYSLRRFNHKLRS